MLYNFNTNTHHVKTFEVNEVNIKNNKTQEWSMIFP